MERWRDGERDGLVKKRTYAISERESGTGGVGC